MKMNRAIGSLFVAMAMLTSSGTSFSQAGDLSTKEGFYSLVGLWTGRGTSVISQEKESVACRGTANEKRKKLEVAISCQAASGGGRLVAYIDLNESNRALSGVWYQSFTGKDGQMRGKLTGTVQDDDTLAMLLNAAGKDRASVLFKLTEENEMNIQIFELTGSRDNTFDVNFKRR